MTIDVPPLLLLAVLAWPGLLAALLAMPAARSTAIALLPWAALPAMLLGLVSSPARLALPYTLDGAALALDAPGGSVLIGIALLWSLAGVCWRLDTHGDPGRWRPAVAALLALLALFALVLADDVLLWLTATTLAGYALYALLARERRAGARAAARRLVIVLVLADLLLFELILILAHGAGATSFSSLREVIAEAADRDTLLLLMLLGLGAKSGVLGGHVWLLPTVHATSTAPRLILIAFVLAAGLFGWLRLLPLGAIVWPTGGLVLGALALATALHALIAGLGRATLDRLQGIVLMALTAQWLMALAVALRQPTLAPAIAQSLPLLGLQTSMTLAALVLLGTASGAGRQGPRLVLAWAAALLGATAPVPILAGWLDLGKTEILDPRWPALVVSLLLGRLLALLRQPAREQRLDPWRGTWIGLAAILVAAAVLMSLSAWLADPLALQWSWPPVESTDSAALGWALLLGGLVLVGWAVTLRLVRRRGWPSERSALPPWGQTRARQWRRWWRRLLLERLPSWREGLIARLSQGAIATFRHGPAASIEAWLLRWEVALVMLILLGFGLAWLVLA